MKTSSIFISGEGEGRGRGVGGGNDEHFSQLTKQCYFTAKIILKYCSGDSMDHVGPPTSD